MEFRKVLVANRGEIAVRIIRALHQMNVEAVAIYSEADRDALHVRLADQAVCVGPAPSTQSYLNTPNIISAALLTGVDAIHPGYGYLSERADFSEICESHGIVFIGPPAAAIQQMGDKAQARAFMRQAGVPVLPGSEGPVSSERQALKVAGEIGYPVLVKASAGGGGRGMRAAATPEELQRVLQPARNEAEAAFGSADVYLERLITRPRHVEIQVLADRHGHAVHLGERECSLQRRHQKVVEESPSPAVSPELRARMGEAALRGVQACGYVNAGTVEFLLDEQGNFYFLEMNTRIQVEHPVTEEVTGLDLVREQIRIAEGEPLGYDQAGVVIRGHAIECRLNAEDPSRNFMPSPGLIRRYHVPGGPGVRVDSAAFAGYVVPPYYDSMFGKLIVRDRDRAGAIARMSEALDELEVEGLATNIALLRAIVRDPVFQAGTLSTDFIEERILKPAQLQGRR
ncbi:acetyl-CoA carboxylase biotin carboxylase subunit [Limnochorda pilosa]|uniref:Biotin carboxylase n=1 Tax=Limnochorda pilosa TaxID=1555112 RepID=A0A0K2SMS2_LIMPI|nr:acetyl-CoA carboxylase biotin carboxylase subunit [Limnochorda pilosa]BAS28428.1 acetyl-CoA carboxylase biotin carboxylase subunit [Limnochorda pilosa]